MAALRVVWGMVWRGLVMGALAGIGMGFGVALCMVGYLAWGELLPPDPYPLEPLAKLVLLTCVSTFIGSVVGAGVGLAVGSVGGLLLALVTLRWFTSLQDPQRYQQTIQAVGFGIGSVPWVGVLLRYAPFRSEDTLPILLVSSGAVVSGLLGGVASRAVVRWYEGDADVSPLPPSPPT